MRIIWFRLKIISIMDAEIDGIFQRKRVKGLMIIINMGMKILPIVLMLLLTNFDFSDMSIKDDAFHDELPIHIETWYFESIFKNNESIVFIITSLSNKNNGILMVGFHFYKNGIIIYEKRKIYSKFFLSNQTPYIVVNGKEILKGFLKNGKICYNLSYSIYNFSFELNFENKTKGWKSDKWLAIPNMEVNGYIYMNGKTERVEGKGYHDHNIFFLWEPFIERGYIDGKIIANNFSIFWARLMGLFHHEDFVIFSESSYMLIKNVTIKCYNYKLNHGRLIPTSFHIFAKNKNLSINITIHSTSIHFIHLPLIKYWQYHINARGEIRDNKLVKIDTNDIMEYMLFQI